MRFHVDWDSLSLSGPSRDRFARELHNLIGECYMNEADEIDIAFGPARLVKVDGDEEGIHARHVTQLGVLLLEELLAEVEYTRGGPAGGVVTLAEE